MRLTPPSADARRVYVRTLVALPLFSAALACADPLPVLTPDSRLVTSELDVGFDQGVFEQLDAGAPELGADATLPEAGPVDVGPEDAGDFGDAESLDAACEGDCAIIDGLRASMRHIPAGTFLMGSPRDQPGALGLEFPQHPVTITRSFWIGSTEVTQAQYRAVLGVSPSHFACGEDCPVETINWLEAITFCNALSQMEGLQECYALEDEEWSLTGLDCTGYRLPTEAEWEFAARAGTTTPFYNGEITNTELQDACEIIDPNSDATAWNCGNSGLETHPVAQKQPNAFGLYDMYGNVWEWVNDWEGYYASDAVSDPIGGENQRNRKIRRGGSYRDVPRYSRSATRVPDLYTGRHYCVGLRVARTAEP